MNALVATDGSKYGRWAMNWMATLPLVEPPRVTALYVVDIAALRAPFLAQPVMPGPSGTFRKKFSTWKRVRPKHSRRRSSSWHC